MSALTVVSANLVRQQLYNAQGALGGSNTRSSEVFYILKAIFLHLAANKGNPDLEYKVVTSGANATLVDSACTLYAAILKKGTVATASYFKVSNHAIDGDSQLLWGAHRRSVIANASQSKLLRSPEGSQA